jgi:hypothetical protein
MELGINSRHPLPVVSRPDLFRTASRHTGTSLRLSLCAYPGPRTAVRPAHQPAQTARTAESPRNRRAIRPKVSLWDAPPKPPAVNWKTPAGCAAGLARRSMSLPRKLVLRPLPRKVREPPALLDLLVRSSDTPPPPRVASPPLQVLMVRSPASMDLLLGSPATRVSLLAQDSLDLRVSSLALLSLRARLASLDLVNFPASPVSPLVPRDSPVLLAVSPAAPPILVRERAGFPGSLGAFPGTPGSTNS